MLKLDGVVAAYDDVTCLHGVSLDVRRGEIVTLIGANGAGKSTTLKTISGGLADRAYVMETGKITMTGSGAQLLADERVRASYLGAKAPSPRRVAQTE